METAKPNKQRVYQQTSDFIITVENGTSFIFYVSSKHIIAEFYIAPL